MMEPPSQLTLLFPGMRQRFFVRNQFDTDILRHPPSIVMHLRQTGASGKTSV